MQYSRSDNQYAFKDAYSKHFVSRGTAQPCPEDSATVIHTVDAVVQPCPIPYQFSPDSQFGCASIASILPQFPFGALAYKKKGTFLHATKHPNFASRRGPAGLTFFLPTVDAIDTAGVGDASFVRIENALDHVISAHVIRGQLCLGGGADVSQDFASFEGGRWDTASGFHAAERNSNVSTVAVLQPGLSLGINPLLAVVPEVAAAGPGMAPEVAFGMPVAAAPQDAMASMPFSDAGAPQQRQELGFAHDRFSVRSRDPRGSVNPPFSAVPPDPPDRGNPEPGVDGNAEPDVDANAESGVDTNGEPGGEPGADANAEPGGNPSADADGASGGDPSGQPDGVSGGDTDLEVGASISAVDMDGQDGGGAQAGPVPDTSAAGAGGLPVGDPGGVSQTGFIPLKSPDGVTTGLPRMLSSQLRPPGTQPILFEQKDAMEQLGRRLLARRLENVAATTPPGAPPGAVAESEPGAFPPQMDPMFGEEPGEATPRTAPQTVLTLLNPQFCAPKATIQIQEGTGQYPASATISSPNGGTALTTSRINMRVCGGYVHEVDRVLMPCSFEVYQDSSKENLQQDERYDSSSVATVDDNASSASSYHQRALRLAYSLVPALLAVSWLLAP